MYNVPSLDLIIVLNFQKKKMSFFSILPSKILISLYIGYVLKFYFLKMFMIRSGL